MIPDGWQHGTLATLIATLEAGVSVNSEDRKIQNGEYGILKTSAVTYGIFDPNAHKTILETELERAAVNPKRDSILISRIVSFQNHSDTETG